MELLIGALLLLWGNLSDNNPDLTMEQLIQASFDTKEALIQQALLPPQDQFLDNNGLIEWIKKDPQPNQTPPIRGVYATGYTAGGSFRLEPLLTLIKETDLNAMVIDVKEDEGYITYKTENPILNEIGASKRMIADMDQLFTILEENDIYPIARIVVFKDTVLANKRPDFSFLNPDGSVWHNSKSNPEAFVNPYMKEVWEYNIEVAREAAALGFKEIQFDYVRFPEGFETRADRLTYEKTDLNRQDIVTEFVKYAREQLNPLGVRVSVDIFGYAASVPAADGIGQNFNDISLYVDVISPMIYPSHYSTGWFGSLVPDAEPYITINGSMIDTHKKLKELGDKKPIIRPWIQDFSAPWIRGHIKYGKEEVEAQIQALYDNDVYEFLLWNSSNSYSPGVNYLLE